MFDFGIKEAFGNMIVNKEIMRDEFIGKMRTYIDINNLDISEYDLRILFDGNEAIQFDIDGTDRDCVYWIDEELFEVRQPKTKEVRYWETDDFGEAMDIMRKELTPNKYKRLI